MKANRPSRRLYRSGEATQEVIIDVAERLFADHGIDAVSMQHIGKVAGQLNTSVVKYHFGDRNGLLYAIYLRRSQEMQPRRIEILHTAAAITPQVIATALILPFVEQARAGSPYPEFLRRLISDGWPASYRPQTLQDKVRSWQALIEAWIAIQPNLSRNEAHRRLSMALSAGLACLSPRQLSAIPAMTSGADIVPGLLSVELAGRAAIEVASAVLSIPVIS